MVGYKRGITAPQHNDQHAAFYHLPHARASRNLARMLDTMLPSATSQTLIATVRSTDTRHVGHSVRPQSHQLDRPCSPLTSHRDSAGEIAGGSLCYIGAIFMEENPGPAKRVSGVQNIHLIDDLHDRIVAAFPTTLTRYHLSSLHLANIAINASLCETLTSLLRLDDLSLNHRSILVSPGFLPLNPLSLWGEDFREDQQRSQLGSLGRNKSFILLHITLQRMTLVAGGV
ncbi:hypothetical protein K438DRAFT_1995864 [Mycena galopus ATCC 62051]|nr:hypothetical protein K438DRAFT_1995864 [Mycena galopus ATCC 62051]